MSDRFGGKPRRKKRNKVFFRKKRPPVEMTFDYKEVDKISSFITEDGKIIPGRVSGLNSRQQRELTTAVKRARDLAFLSASSSRTIQ